MVVEIVITITVDRDKTVVGEEDEGLLVIKAS